MNPLNVDGLICLSLDKRKDLWKRLESDCYYKDYNFDPFIVGDGNDNSLRYDRLDTNELPPAFHQSINYPTWWKRPNAYQAWLSHKEMMKKCLREKMGSVLFLEDDSTFTKNFDDIIPIVEDFAISNEWDMFYLGSYAKPIDVMFVHPNIIKLGGQPAGGFHAVCLKRHIMEKLINFPPYGPFDWLCQQYLHKIYKCFAVCPSIIKQSSGWSFVEDQPLEKPDV